MELTKLCVVVVVVVVLCMSEGAIVTHSLFNKIHVHVINGFSRANETLHAHCYSKDDDIGLHDIPVRGEIMWSFRTNLFGTTRFKCSFWWSGGFESLDVFWADEQFINLECGGHNCRWVSRDDRIYFFSVYRKEYRFVSNWNFWMCCNSSALT